MGYAWAAGYGQFAAPFAWGFADSLRRAILERVETVAVAANDMFGNTVVLRYDNPAR